MEIARKINAAIALGTFAPERTKQKPILCKEALEHWRKTYAPTLKPSYRLSSAEVIRLHLTPFFGSLDVREVREEHLLDYVRKKLAEERAPRKEGEPRERL